MSIILHPLSATALWLTLDSMPASYTSCPADTATPFFATPKAADYLAQHFPYIPYPYHVLVSQGRRNATRGFRFHRLSSHWQDIPTYQVMPGLFLPSPEATLATLAPGLSFHELVYLGSCFCSSFRFNPATEAGIAPREPLTSPAKLERFVKTFPAFRGQKVLRPALPFIFEGSESPPEVFMAMIMRLPACRGGFALDEIMANLSYLPSPRALEIAKRGHLRPDLMMLSGTKLLALEYDSDSIHLSSDQAARDEAKRLALEADGFKVISIRPSHLADSHYMGQVADEIKRYFSIRIRPPADSFYQAQTQLFHMDRSLSQFLIFE